MKTSIEISDALFEEAKRVAEREKTTLRDLVEAGLRFALDARKKRPQFKLKLITAGEGGLREGVSPELPRALAYDLPDDE
jgi:hypothetical protein